MSDYHSQLTNECTNSTCLKIFCRRHYNNTTIDKISKILSKYSDIFLCRNINSILARNDLIYKYYIIDLYFYVDNLIYKCTSSSKIEAHGFNLGNIKNKKSGSPSTNKRRKLKSTGIKPCQELEHKYCEIINKVLSQVDLYLTIGIIHLLLQKFNKIKNFNIALIIIRLFLKISRTSCIDQAYYELLADVYDYVFTRMLDSIIKLELSAPISCISKNCLFQLKISRSDFQQSVNYISKALNASIITDIRENCKIKNLLEILKILYNMNCQIILFDYEQFYLHNFCRKLCLKTEFKFMRAKQDTALNYDFILPIHIKSEVIKNGNGDIMKSTLQDAFFRSLFEGITEPYLFITIRREFIYEETLEIIKKLQDSDLKKQLKIKFLDEDGIDSGGIRKEYFQLLSHEISHDSKLFMFRNNRIWFKPGVDLLNLTLIGKIIGIALYNNVVLNIPFPSLIFKKMLRIPLDFEDMEEIEPVSYLSISNLAKCTEEEIERLDLLFTIDYEVDGLHKVEELVEDGKSMQITKSNLDDFKKVYSQFYMTNLIKSEFVAFLDGFLSIIKFDTIVTLRPKELEKIIMGLDEFNLEVIRKSATYTGYTSETQIIKDFWGLFENYSLHNKKRLLQFITGNDRIPVSGSESLNLIIMKNGCDTDRLPSSQTCFNTLLLPEYSTREKLEQKLNTAISLTAGFYLL